MCCGKAAKILPATAVGTCYPSSVILPVLASVRHSARSQRIANLVSNAVEVEQGFLKPSIETAFDESRTRFQSASLNGYARLPGGRCPIERHPSGFHGVPV